MAVAARFPPIRGFVFLFINQYIFSSLLQLPNLATMCKKKKDLARVMAAENFLYKIQYIYIYIYILYMELMKLQEIPNMDKGIAIAVTE